MKLAHIVVSLSISVFTYCALDSILGSVGAAALSQLQTYEQKLSQNVESLEDLNLHLSLDVQRLQSDPGRLREEAYKIGMLGADEVKLRIPDTPNSEGPVSPGTVLTRPLPNNDMKPLISGLAISIGFVALLLLTIFQFELGLVRKNNGRKKLQGIRVQTASLE